MPEEEKKVEGRIDRKYMGHLVDADMRKPLRQARIMQIPGVSYLLSCRKLLTTGIRMITARQTLWNYIYGKVTRRKDMLHGSRDVILCRHLMEVIPLGIRLLLL